MITLAPFDARNATGSDWAAFHGVRRALFAEDAPEIPVPSDAATEAQLRLDADPQWSSRRWLAYDEGVPVGRLQVALRGGDDPARYAGRVFVVGGVMPERRRRGVGTAMARHLLALMQQEKHSLAGFPLSALEAGAPFLARLGGTLAHREVDNRLLLPGVDRAGLADHIRRVPQGLRWEEHRGRVPLQRLHSLAPQMSALLADVPMGELSLPPPLFEVASYEAMYRRMDELGGTHVFVLLCDGEQVAAVCDAGVNAAAPSIAMHNFTGVARPWRSRGLALAVKARTLQLLLDDAPEVITVQTRNAAINAAMLRVNAHLGFRVHRESGVFEVRREQLERSLALM